MDLERIEYLMHKYLQNAISEIETTELFQLIDKCNDVSALQTIFHNVWKGFTPTSKMPENVENRILRRIFKE